ncbi:MAG: hypothetical protein OXG78_01885 [Chloroflexi bacterium]|nr:hypothetical protein [Chloroflexota bacterium]
MGRLQELHDVEAPGLEPESSYQVSHERLGDTIYYEVRTLIKQGFESKSQKRIVTGEIREVDPTRTEVRGEFKKVGFRMYAPTVLQFIDIVVALCLIWAAIEGQWPIFFVILLPLIAVHVVTSVLVNYRALDRAPTLERIELCLQPDEEDRALIAQRREEHRLHLAEASRALRSGEDVGREISTYERG